MPWSEEFAGEIRKRDNKSQIGPQIGEVIATDPLRISMQGGAWILEGAQLYLCATLAEEQPREAKVTFDPIQASLQTINEHGSIIGEGVVTFQKVLAVGDTVICIPISTIAGKAQKFAVVDRMVQNVSAV